MSNTKELKWGYITPAGEFAILPAFDGAHDFSEGLAAVKVDWARGYIDSSGSWVIDPVFEAAGDFHGGVAIVKIDGDERLIDREGNYRGQAAAPQDAQSEITSGFNPRYELHHGLMRFIENQKYGFKDKEGNVVIKAKYTDATDFSEGLACVRKGKTSQWGYIDTAGHEVISPRFRQARPFHEGLAAVLCPIDS